MSGSPNASARQLRVGFVTQLLWDRYGGFWRDLVAGAGALPVYAQRDQVLAAAVALDEAAVLAAPFRLAAAQAATLAACDLIVLPRLNPESDSQRGSAQDRWVADLPGAIADAVPALSQVHEVAAYPDPDIETNAVQLLQRLISDQPTVPRVWSRHRKAAERQASGAGGQRGPATAAATRALATGGVTAVVAQPWLLSEPVASRLLADDERLITQLTLDPSRCREEGWRVDERLVATDAEVIGAARMLSRRAGVARLRFLLDEHAGSDAWLLRRLSQVSHKPVEPWPWPLALGGEAEGPDAVGPDAVGPDALLYLPVD